MPLWFVRAYGASTRWACLRNRQAFSLVNDISPDQIEQSLLILGSTVPDRPQGTSVDFLYGDPRELLSIAEWELVQVLLKSLLNPEPRAGHDVFCANTSESVYIRQAVRPHGHF